MRDVAACIDRHTQFRDPVVDYSKSNGWVDVKGKIDRINAPFKELGFRPCTVHPTASNTGKDVTRIWYEKAKND